MQTKSSFARQQKELIIFKLFAVIKSFKRLNLSTENSVSRTKIRREWQCSTMVERRDIATLSREGRVYNKAVQ